jgi:hypothetical protein
MYIPDIWTMGEREDMESKEKTSSATAREQTLTTTETMGALDGGGFERA